MDQFAGNIRMLEAWQLTAGIVDRQFGYRVFRVCKVTVKLNLPPCRHRASRLEGKRIYSVDLHIHTVACTHPFSMLNGVGILRGIEAHIKSLQGDITALGRCRTRSV